MHAKMTRRAWCPPEFARHDAEEDDGLSSPGRRTFSVLRPIIRMFHFLTLPYLTLPLPHVALPTKYMVETLAGTSKTRSLLARRGAQEDGEKSSRGAPPIPTDPFCRLDPSNLHAFFLIVPHLGTSLGRPIAPRGLTQLSI